MLIKTRGIVFKAKKYSETSVIVDVFTEEKGLRSYIVSGVRSKRPTVSAGLLQPMTPVELCGLPPR
ncbi:MAG: recombination protein O N-terminal domain-containing protein [Saprospiraceae bacterium]|nr:recombination protein O N-terminal domain-containing protein [Saprospiraceae bacterium]